MIGFRYLELDPDLLEQLRDFERLLRIFHHLVLQSDGDVEQALRQMKHLQELGYLDRNLDLEQFRGRIEDEGLVSLQDGVPKLTIKGERFLRLESLNQIFHGLKKGAFGEHRTPHSGDGGERLPETRPWEYGEELSDLDLQKTLRNALARTGPELRLAEEDFEVSETEHRTGCATVLLVDVSHSMILYGEDRITPAKKVALGLAELVRTRYPKDTMDVVLFGDDAVRIPARELPYIGAGPFHTNTRAGLQLARRILARKKHPNKQVFMVTDGKATAITEGGKVYKNPFSLDPRITNRTLEEAAACRRDGVVITTFMLTRDPGLVDFVDRLTKTNRGRAYYSSCDDLAGSVFVDYLRNRKRRVRG